MAPISCARQISGQWRHGSQGARDGYRHTLRHCTEGLGICRWVLEQSLADTRRQLYTIPRWGWGPDKLGLLSFLRKQRGYLLSILYKRKRKVPSKALRIKLRGWVPTTQHREQALRLTGGWLSDAVATLWLDLASAWPCYRSLLFLVYTRQREYPPCTEP